ncbi:MAG TPA: penicillin-binding protein 2 [Methylococcaceae bacterium]|jgi:penicillin-binding protein 2|nr:penicillin-binding protein 2 [Methylococcaceae bacterium]HIN69291.1 penicillin-binding protein 2 [Methylococcales bacterium]HIA45141.1 penicillin-binding protein 2 [Methylococcaceae bacterium]HIB61577.1 penicillin-binding protein 2 [Methylococcaceae bacterium]HIO13299.1 penicillin-binding protein 2 [Methylococcales bacterium]
MHRRFALKDIYSENRLFLSRIVIIFIVILLLMGAIIARLIYLQITGHEYYVSQANNNRIKISSLPPTRGIIYDRYGKVLADNIPSYSLELTPELIPDITETLTQLKHLLNLSEETLTQFKKQLTRHRSFDSIPLLLQMNDTTVARFAVVQHQFPGVDIHARLIRHYPYGKMAAHLVGYVGRINETELKTLSATRYKGTHSIGKTGIEKAYEEQLHGKPGHAEVETNAQLRPIRVIKSEAPIPGKNLHLTLDIELQNIAYQAFKNHNGAAVAIEIATGDVLSMLSHPGFDPNPFSSGISTKAYNLLQQSDRKPLFDRALKGQYPPGSTLKPFIALAGLQYALIQINTPLFCPGYYQLPNVSHRYRDWKIWGHGFVTLNDAIVQSCDVYFYDLARTLGIDRIHHFLSQFGFGQKTGIDLVGEKSGLLPSRNWKRQNKNLPWYPGETLITGIGQGFMQTTPLQLAVATATLANQGISIRPHLIKPATASEPKPMAEKINIDPAYLSDIINSMINVVHTPKGTAYKLSQNINFKIAGKTGTAQVFTVKQKEKYEAEKLKEKLLDHALFIAFAPANAPEIAVAVIVENGGHGGSTAAPIAKKIIAQYLKKASHHD